MTETHPYGAWPSPISATDVSDDKLDFGHVALADKTAYWLERRPDEGGRGVIVRADQAGETTEITPGDHDVRTLVHEYGGGDFGVHDGTVVYARFADQRLYRTAGSTDETKPITPEPPVEHGARYADLSFVPGEKRLYCVRERHYGEDAAEEAVNELVMVDLTGETPPEVVDSGHDFYSFPRVSPDGDRLAWTTWDHPQMPWDGTELHVAQIESDGTLTDVKTVMGGSDESVFQPAWGPEGELYAVSDRTGWWNLYLVVETDGTVDPTPIREEDASFGGPQWVFGLSTYDVLPDGNIVALRHADEEVTVGLIDPDDGSFEPQPAPVVGPAAGLRTNGTTMLTTGGGPAQPASVVRWELGDAGEQSNAVIRQSFTLDVDASFVSEPEAVTFPTTDGDVAHAYYYPPANPEVDAPEGDRPPLVTMVHGGPTSRTSGIVNLDVQFFTTRGFGVVDVNYRGSTGYGRAYRDTLLGEWGIVDVADCVNAAKHLAETGRGDPDRLAIRGGSAGGFATLAALAFHDTFAAGASYYGVADLRALAEHTHKFESRYLDGLVGPLPEAADIYEERSPAGHADGIDAPLLVLQGGEDRVVPPTQADEMVRSLVDTGTPYAYLEFENERHGFRSAAARRRALETELAFYAAAFSIDPPGVDPLELTRGEYHKEVVTADDE